MKTRTLTLLTLAILASLLLGAYTFNALSAPKELKLKAKWKPAAYLINAPVPDPWKVEIYFAPPRPVQDINATTLRLEQTIMWDEEHPPYMHTLKDRLVVSYHGADVLGAALLKMTHTGPGTYVVYLEITGKLYDNTPFRGTGSITLVIDSELPP